MFPPFVSSFGDQLFAVMINLVGTVASGLFNSLFTSFVATVVTPWLKNLATGLGLTTM